MFFQFHSNNQITLALIAENFIISTVKNRLKPLQPLKKLKFKIQRFLANLSKAKFFAMKTSTEILSPKPKLRILFSEKCQGEQFIKRGFQLIHHHVDFQAISPEKIKDYDLVIPLNMDDLRLLQSTPELTKNNLIPIPSFESTVICDDKFLFNQTLKEKGFSDYLPKTGENLSYPFLVKKKVSEAGWGCHFVYNSEQKEKYMDLIESEDYFCQEIIKGKNEFDSHILFKNHQILASITIKNAFEKDSYLKGRDKFIYTKIVDSPYLNIFSDILDAIGFEGLCCFNYKENNGKPSIFEINPRFDGSLSRYFFTFLRSLN